MTDQVTLPAFFDAHVHLRKYDTLLHAVAPHTAKVCSAAVVMPNVPEVRDGFEALRYRDAIRAATGGYDFEPLMTVKLNNQTTAGLIVEAHGIGVVAAKVYPTGVTTGSHDGVDDIKQYGEVLAAMESLGMVLCVHGEKPGSFVLDRERDYLGEVWWVLDNYPDLKVVLEHVTTGDVAEMVTTGPDNLAATVTAHHLYLTLDDVIGDGIRPHNFCYPVAKRPWDRDTLVKLARTHPRFFLGSDSAPHLKGAKESACGCAGVYTAPVLAQVLAQMFIDRPFNFFHGGLRVDAVNREDVEQLREFACTRGPAFYGREPSTRTITLYRKPYVVPAEFDGVVPFMAGETLSWSLEA